MDREVDFSHSKSVGGHSLTMKEERFEGIDFPWEAEWADFMRGAWKGSPPGVRHGMVWP